VVSRPLGAAANGLLRSAGLDQYTNAVERDLDYALGIWLRELRLVLINGAHPKLAGLDGGTREEMLARIAWHEWGHALSIARCSEEHVSAGVRLLQLAPEGIRNSIRNAGYGERQYTHEVIAETYALMMLRRLAGGSGQPSWLNDEIYELLTETTGWSG
jgi:hypothetical protein